MCSYVVRYEFMEYMRKWGNIVYIYEYRRERP